MKAVLIQVNGTRTTIDWNNENIATILSSAVGGCFERIQLGSKGMEMYVNDNGIAEGLDPNPLATTFYMQEYGLVPPIFGDAVLLGPTDHMGYSRGLEPIQVSQVYDTTNMVTFDISEVPESDLGDEITEEMADAFIEALSPEDRAEFDDDLKDHDDD